jgi:hypothetical protein
MCTNLLSSQTYRSYFHLLILVEHSCYSVSPGMGVRKVCGSGIELT